MENQKLEILEVNFVSVKSENVLARADVQFNGFLLRGFKIILDRKTNKGYVTAPSYSAGSGWRPLFRTDNKDDWVQICRRILEEFNLFQKKETEDEIKKEEIPF